MAGFYLHVSNTDSKKIHSRNRWVDFIVELDQQIVLSKQQGAYGFGYSRSWSVALVDLTIDQTFNETGEGGLPESVVVLCDLVAQSYIGGTQQPLLRTISGGKHTSTSLFTPHYIAVTQSAFNRLRIQVKKLDLWDLDLGAKSVWKEQAELRCTLHFQLN